MKAIYLHNGKEFFKEDYPFKRRYAKGQKFTMNSIETEVVEEFIDDKGCYIVKCSVPFLSGSLL